MDKKYRIMIILFLFFVLTLVRAFQHQLFYDPFIEYFKNDYLYNPMPAFSGSKLLISLIFRYGINTFISLIIIYIAFENKSFVIIDRGREIDEHSAFFVENGIFKGLGFFNLNYQINTIEVLQSIITPMENNRDVQHIIKSYLRRNKRLKIVKF